MTSAWTWDSFACAKKAVREAITDSKNIISHLGSEEFMRIRIGVGDKPAGSDLVDYVLGSFSKEEKKILDETKRNAVLAIETIISDGIDKAMNLYNTTRRSPT